MPQPKKPTSKSPLLSILMVAAMPLALTGCFGEPENLDQNWTEQNNLRELSYHTSQGSQLIPYDWFMHLQAPNSRKLLRSNSVIESLRYLPDYTPDPAYNPDGLPIGFVKDEDPNTGNWIGINCAACHTGQFIFGETVVRIDGAPAMGDYAGLLTTTRDALAQTLENNGRFNKFASQLPNVSNNAERETLRTQMQASVDELTQSIHNASSSAHTPGFGRIDAFAAIRNEVFVTDLGIPENYQVPSAPVSYPFLWDTPHLDHVQWTGHVENPYARNTGQVLGVMGRLNLQDPAQLFDSSVRRDAVFLLEEWLAELSPPKWPEEILGDINTAAAERGHTLYTTTDATGYSCVDCHTLKDDNGQYPLTPADANAFGQQFIETFNISLEEIGTDPNTLLNVYDPTPLSTGILADVFGQPQMPGGILLSMITRATVGNLFTQTPALTQEQQVAYSRYRIGRGTPIHIGYKARPLAGIWATSPYLHNGSVPDLYTLLLPPEDRKKTFWVGSMHFNPLKVGYMSHYKPAAFKFNTQVSGNSNAGHVYGTQLSNQQRWDLIEFLKTL